MKYHVAFFLFVSVFIISTATMFLAPFKSQVIEYKPMPSDENAYNTSNEDASTDNAVSATKENKGIVTTGENQRELSTKENKGVTTADKVQRKSGKTNKTRRLPEAKPATPTPMPTHISGEAVGFSYVNITCAVISAIGAVFSAIFGWRQDRRYRP